MASLEEEVRHLERVQVDAEIMKKMEDSPIKALIGAIFLKEFNHYAFICKFTDSAGKMYTGFVRCNKTTFERNNAGDIINVTAYKGVKKGDLYLQPYQALWEK